MVIRKCRSVLVMLSTFVVMWSAGSSALAQDGKLTDVTLQLPWVMLGVYDPFVLAAQRGFYKEVGLNVIINEGSGSLTAAQTVANNRADFGYADVSSGLTLASKGAKIKYVAVFMRTSALVITYRPPVKIDKFEDLRGVSVVHGANDAPSQVFSALLAKNKMTWNDVKATIVAPTAFAQSFLSDKNSVLLGNYYSTYQSIKTRDPLAKFVLYSDFGVNLMGSGILVSESMLASKPDVVRRFLAATIKGFEAAVKDPDAAVEAAAAAFPMVVRPKKEINKAELLAGLRLLSAPGTEGKPLGWTGPQHWQQTFELLRDNAGLDPKTPVANYYTNDFLPK